MLTVGGVAAGVLALAVGPALAVADIGPGSTNVAGVKCVQRGVNFFESPLLAVDGKYGALTTEAVEDLQAEFGIGVDGVVGPITGGKLKAEVLAVVIALHHTGGNAGPEDAWLSQCGSQIP